MGDTSTCSHLPGGSNCCEIPRASFLSVLRADDANEMPLEATKLEQVSGILLAQSWAVSLYYTHKSWWLVKVCASPLYGRKFHCASVWRIREVYPQLSVEVNPCTESKPPYGVACIALVSATAGGIPRSRTISRPCHAKTGVRLQAARSSLRRRASVYYRDSLCGVQS